MADIELLCLVDLTVAWSLRSRGKRWITAHISINHTLWDVIGRQDCSMQQILHLYLDIKNELAAVEKFSQARLGVEFPRYADIDLLGYLLQLDNPILLHQPIGWRSV